MDKPKTRLYAEKTSFWVEGMVILLVLAAAFQVVGCWGLWSDRFFVITQIVLPALSFLLFALFVSLLGRKALWLSVLPFLGGVGFYALRFWNAGDMIVTVAGIVFCALALVLYMGTVFNLIRTKWLLVILFAIPFGYRAFYRDVKLLQDLEHPVSFAAGMQEMSLLCVVLGLLLLSLGMRKYVKELKNKDAAAPAAESSPAAAPAPAPAAAPVVEAAPAPVEPEALPVAAEPVNTDEKTDSGEA